MHTQIYNHCLIVSHSLYMPPLAAHKLAMGVPMQPRSHLIDQAAMRGDPAGQIYWPNQMYALCFVPNKTRHLTGISRPESPVTASVVLFLKKLSPSIQGLFSERYLCAQICYTQRELIHGGASSFVNQLRLRLRQRMRERAPNGDIQQPLAGSARQRPSSARQAGCCRFRAGLEAH